MNLPSRKKLIAVLTDPQIQTRTLTVAICLLGAVPVFAQAGTGRSACATWLCTDIRFKAQRTGRSACATRSRRQRDSSARRLTGPD